MSQLWNAFKHYIDDTRRKSDDNIPQQLKIIEVQNVFMQQRNKKPLKHFLPRFISYNLTDRWDKLIRLLSSTSE